MITRPAVSSTATSLFGPVVSERGVGWDGPSGGSIQVLQDFTSIVGASDERWQPPKQRKGKRAAAQKSHLRRWSVFDWERSGLFMGEMIHADTHADGERHPG